MQAFYVSQIISENISKTPEGYLLCRNVPIARSGYQKYTGHELGQGTSDIYNVFRSEKEVFNPATIASFEGKTITDSHPPKLINVGDDAIYNRGHGQNVKRGTGDEIDLLLADLLVKDPTLIGKIEGGLREVSSGYDVKWVQGATPYELEQVDIRGNHIAIVPKGRAGDRVAIRDSIDNPKKEKKPMNILKHIFGLGMKEYIKDAEPEKVTEALEKAKEAEEGKDCRGAKDTDEEVKKDLKEVKDSISAINDTLAKLVESDKKVHEKVEDALDAEIEKMEKGEEKKEDKEDKKDEAKDGASELVKADVLTGEELPTNPIGDSGIKLAVLRTLKPVIAGIKDATERKAVTDALIKAVRDAKPVTQQMNYGDLLKVSQITDKASEDQGAKDAALGQELKAKFHRKPMAKKS
jgi:hypothetical protein